MDLTKRISRGLKAHLGARLIFTLSNAVLLFALTRYLLSPEEYGLLYFAHSALGIGSMAAMLGLPKSTGRYVNEFLATDEGQVRHVIRISFTYLVVLAGIVSLLVTLLHEPLARALGDTALTPFLMVGGAYVGIRALYATLGNIFQGFNRVDYNGLLGAVNGVGRVVFALGFVLLGFGALGAFFGYVIGFGLATLVGGYVLWWRLLPDLEVASERAEDLTRRILEYSVPTAATRVSVVLDSKVDKVLIGMLAGPAAVGFYTLAEQIVDFCIVPARSLGFTISPAIGDREAAGGNDTATRLYEQSMEKMLLLYLPAAVGLILVAEPAVRYVFGTDYLGAVPVLRLFGIFIVVRAIHKITGNGLDYLGLARIRAIARGTTALGNVGLNILLIPPFGVLGAGIATVVTYSIYTGINVYYMHRELGLRWMYLAGRTARIAGIALVMGAVVSQIVPYVSGILTLAVAIATGLVVWTVLSVASGLLDLTEVRSFFAGSS